MAVQPPSPLTSAFEGADVVVAPSSTNRGTRRFSLEIIVPAGFIIFMLGACFIWPLVYSVPNPVGGSLVNANLPPLSAHAVFGTDPTGNDILSRILYGGRVSFEIGFSVNLIGMGIGGSIGLLAGYLGGVIDTVLMRILDVFIAFPGLILALAIADALGPSETHVIWALSFFSIPSFARIARASTLPYREQPFILAASLAGTRVRRVLLRHIVPNIMPRLVTFALLGFGIVILVAGALSFLGYGVPPPGPDWGNMIALGSQNLSVNPDLVIIPSAFLFATVIAFNMLGDALRYRWGVR